MKVAPAHTPHSDRACDWWRRCRHLDCSSGEAGGVAAAVSDCAALIVTLDDTGAAVLTDTNTAVGLTFAAIGQGLGDGGEVLGVGAYVGAVAAAVAAEAGLLQVLASAWKSSTPFIDPGKLAITGHAMGGVVALLTASLTDDYKSVIAASPTGGMAYAFEKSGTFGPALVAGLADAVGATPAMQPGTVLQCFPKHYGTG